LYYWKNQILINGPFIEREFSLIKLHGLFLFSCFLISPISYSKEYSPTDVYAEALFIQDKIEQWKLKQGLSAKWKEVPFNEGYKPRHVFQKAVEVLEKINHYRTNILKIGAIPINYPVGREVTPNEVFIEVQRIHEELLVMLQIMGVELTQQEGLYKKIKPVIRVPSDVFAKLSEISVSMDELLGLRGISPSDVYVRSQQLVDYAIFLRRSQNLHTDITRPTKTTQKSPNHSLEAVRILMIKINKININLFNEAVRVVEVSRRVIEPSDVYSSMGIVLAELHRLQHQLGLEKFMPKVTINEVKTPDDIIFNIRLATLLLPDFDASRTIQSFDKKLLTKTPNHVFSLTSYIIKELEKFSRFRGINVPLLTASKNQNLKPKHVYVKALEAIDKIVKLRESQAKSNSAIPRFPVRDITPQEVFNLSLRIDEYLGIIYHDYGMPSKPWNINNDISYFSGKTPTDVYGNMLRINSLLQHIQGNQGRNITDLFDKVNVLNADMDQILKRHSLPLKTTKETTKHAVVNLNDIFKKLNNAIVILTKIKIAEGHVDNAKIRLPSNKIISMPDVYQLAWRVEAELAELKLILGIEHSQTNTLKKQAKALSDVYLKAASLVHKLLMLSNQYPQISQ